MNKKKIIKLLISTMVIISLFGEGYIIYKLNGSLNNSNKTIVNLEKDIINIKKNVEEKDSQINKLSDELQNTTNELQKSKNIIDQQKKELDDMMKSVSYNPYDITVPSGATVYHVKKALKDTALQPLAPTLVKIEKEKGINAFVIAGLLANESKWGKSDRAINQNNLTGYAVYTPLSRGSSFNSKDECVIKTAELLKNEYLNPNGEHYNGKSIWNVNIKYCQDKNGPNMEWSKTINSIANNLVHKANS